MLVSVPNAPDVPETSKMLEDVDNVSAAAAEARLGANVARVSPELTPGCVWALGGAVGSGGVLTVFSVCSFSLFILSTLPILCGGCVLTTQLISLNRPPLLEWPCLLLSLLPDGWWLLASRLLVASISSSDLHRLTPPIRLPPSSAKDP